MKDQQEMDKYVSGAYFDVKIGGVSGLSGKFTSVRGLGMAVGYQTYFEGGSMTPHFLVENAIPQQLVLEQGTVTEKDAFSSWIENVNGGVSNVVDGDITLKDAAGNSVRSWHINDAVLVSYTGPDLDSNSPQLAVSRIVLMYGGCS
ncbi:MAG: phage tail protein [Lachnospiraceae bacterium]|nr:phage tail protein [Lachnospiraceae bacterium]